MRVGVEEKIVDVGVFVSGGPALARMVNSVTCPGTEPSAYRIYSAILMATRSAEFLTASRSRCA